ncbi:MAG: cupin domain-containing protein [Thermogemmata sp.]|jgi:predicted cupin superfamily sugar epimerase|uniref:Cupin domain-containing protein n=1 Tax=Thermogemmata fonticola TaxID=2755323 RepID=A0A7V8VBY8_9BACT|nr:cupin domain-containing protein [Thermogemmata fonticola]MBA2225227.1 cupin domain-containing protein [Thermogemmata fonticola]MCX8139458.1 cupin domain-containing protein [Gemmataceae bacterium]
MTADDVIRLLQLEPHPTEGGYFRETYRSALQLPSSILPAHSGSRSLSTAIYYLLRPGQVSELHLLPSDEIFHFYLGQPVGMLQLHPDGSGREIILGQDLNAGQLPQVVVPAGVWQGSRLLSDSGFALLGCTVAPGFDYADYRRGSRAELIQRWPAFAQIITLLTPNG